MHPPKALLHVRSPSLLTPAPRLLHHRTPPPPPPPPEVCINLQPWADLLDAPPPQQCICQPATVSTIGSLAGDAEDWLIKSLIGIGLMIAAWVVLLMRLAALHDVARWRQRALRRAAGSSGAAPGTPGGGEAVQEGGSPQFLISAGRGERGGGGGEDLLP